MDRKSMVGERFNRLVVMNEDTERNNLELERFRNGLIKQAGFYYVCKCDCGNEKSIRSCHLSSGMTKSCGCLNQENRKINSKKNTKQNTYEKIDNYYKVYDIKLENFFLISEEDFGLATGYCWSKDFSSGGYWKASAREGGRKIIKLHQEIAKRIDSSYMPSMKIVPDHIGSDLVNRKEDDNRRDKIRIVTRSDNNKNHKTQSNNTSGKQGVNWLKCANKWIARIYDNNGNRIHRLFDNFDDAVKQRVDWEIEYGYIGD